MNILFFDADKWEVGHISFMINYVKENLNEDMIALPKDFNLITDCSLEQLKAIRDLIDKDILKKEGK